MLHGDISPSPGADGVSDGPGHTDASPTHGHSSQVMGQESTTLRGSEQVSSCSWEPTGPGAVSQTGEGVTQPPRLTSQFLTATLIQRLGRWGKASHSNDFSYFRIKPILGDRCLSVSVLSTALT